MILINKSSIYETSTSALSEYEDANEIVRRTTDSTTARISRRPVWWQSKDTVYLLEIRAALSSSLRGWYRAFLEFSSRALNKSIYSRLGFHVCRYEFISRPLISEMWHRRYALPSIERRRGRRDECRVKSSSFEKAAVRHYPPGSSYRLRHHWQE